MPVSLQLFLETEGFFYLLFVVVLNFIDHLFKLVGFLLEFSTLLLFVFFPYDF